MGCHRFCCDYHTLMSLKSLPKRACNVLSLPASDLEPSPEHSVIVEQSLERCKRLRWAGRNEKSKSDWNFLNFALHGGRPRRRAGQHRWQRRKGARLLVLAVKSPLHHIYTKLRLDHCLALLLYARDQGLV